MLLLMLATGCLVDRALYEQRLAELSDGDGDGYAAPEAGGDDCDDSDASVHPDADEIAYDAVDQDCDGADLVDVDGDGVAATDAGGFDCDDADGGVHPGASEVPYDGVDQDCDGADLTDVDGDGVDAGDAGGEDCDDADDAVHPGEPEVPYDGVDQDCDGADLDDQDGDGFSAPDPDCNDADSSIHPDAGETWADGFTDNDCDGDPDPASTSFGTETRTGVEGSLSGARVSALDDLDGDGSREWLVGAYFDASEYPGGGSVFVESGAGSGRLADGAALLAGGSNWYLGTDVDAVEDVTGDGVADILVGSTGVDGGAGAAFLVDSASMHGGDVDLPGGALLELTGEEPSTFAGAQTRSCGDLDGDGIPELLVSAPFLPVDGFENAGRVYAVSSDATGIVSLADAAWTWDGYFVGGDLGNGVQRAGDQDGDGYEDVMVSMDTGLAAWIAPGGGTGGIIRDVAIAGIYNADETDISSVEMVGDVDGDGTSDLMVLGDIGYVHIDLTGTPFRLLDEAVYATITEGDGTVLSSAVDLGDRDGDGRSETAVGAPYHLSLGTGWVGVIAGSAWDSGDLTPTSIALSATSVRPFAASGSALALFGDVDGDGQDDLGIGAPGDDEGGTDAGGVVVLPVPQ